MVYPCSWWELRKYGYICLRAVPKIKISHTASAAPVQDDDLSMRHEKLNHRFIQDQQKDVCQTLAARLIEIKVPKG